MKTYYFRQLKSGNYEVATEENHTHSTTDLRGFFQFVSGQKTTTYDRVSRRFKYARIIKARYSQSQTYFQSAIELEKHLS